MKCYLIRHSITDANEKKYFNGCRSDDPLTQEGRDLIKPIDDVEKDAVVFCSPMRRARETAAIMLPGFEPVIIDDLKEMDFGRFEGKNHEMLQNDPEYIAWLESGGALRVPDGEKISEFIQRIMRGLGKALAEAKARGADTLYIVAHGGTLMASMSTLTGESYFDFNTPNGAGFVIELETDNAGNITAETSYDRFFGGLRDGSSDWRPPQYTPSDSVDR